METKSVIIVSWNAKGFLLKCLESILAQGASESIEIIVVDNASSDGSPDAVLDAFPMVKVIRNNENYGFAKANNIGIRASKGKHLFLVNSDVVVSAGCFDKLIAYIDEHPEIGLLGPKIIGADGDVLRSCMRYPSLGSALSRALALDSLFPRSRRFGNHLLTYWGHDETRSVEVINGCFWMIRRSAMEQVGLLDERFLIYGEDIDWCRRFTESGWQVVFYPETEALHYGGGSSSNAPVKFYLEMQRANYQYWLKHHSPLASSAFLLINLLHHTLRAVGEVVALPFARHRRKAANLKIARNVASIKWAIRTMVVPGSRRRLLTAERSL